MLIISYFLHPDEDAGARRVDSLAALLPQFGWQPTVVTYPSVPLSSRRGRVVHTLNPGPLVSRWWKRRRNQRLKQPTGGASRSAAGLLRLVKVGARATMHSLQPDPQVAWGPAALFAAEQLLANEKFDALFTTGPPHTVQVVGALLKRRFPQVAWVAELRDPWSSSAYNAEDSQISRQVAHRMERWALQGADALVAVSRLHADEIGAQNQRAVQCIPTGVSMDEAAALRGKPVADDGPFRLVHAGSLLRGLRDPGPVLRAVLRLREEGAFGTHGVQVDFYGQVEPVVTELTKRLGLEDVVVQHGVVPRQVVLAGEQEADVLLLLTWKDPRDLGSLPSKLFEYIAVGKPVLAFGYPRQVGCELVSSLNAGHVVQNDTETYDALRLLLERRGQFQPVPLSQLGQFSREGAVQRVAGVLDEVIAGAPAEVRVSC